jgi:hypothetical protein
MQRQEVWFVDHSVEPERIGLIVVRPFHELAHVGYYGSRQVAGCGQRKATVFNRLPQKDQRIAGNRRVSNFVNTKRVGDPNCMVGSRRLTLQGPQAVECQQYPGWLDPV